MPNTTTDSHHRTRSLRRRRRSGRVWLAGAIGATAVLAAPAAGALAGGGHDRVTFERVDAAMASPSGHSVLADCGGDPEGWPDARLRAKVRQRNGHTYVDIKMRHARPDTYFTVWLRLGGTDNNGDAYGRNPVTDGRATPMSPSWDLDDLLVATGPGNGGDDLSNGFRTDHDGNARLRTTLDFPLHGGAYPFHRFPSWDPTDPRLPAANPAIYPVAIAGPEAPYTLRIVSHCTDDVGHGLQSGPRELWFDWTRSD